MPGARRARRARAAARMRWLADPLGEQGFVGEPNFAFIFICAFALVTLLQQICMAGTTSRGKKIRVWVGWRGARGQAPRWQPQAPPRRGPGERPRVCTEPSSKAA